jgi:hypothetical protein
VTAADEEVPTQLRSVALIQVLVIVPEGAFVGRTVSMLTVLSTLPGETMGI